MAPIQNGNYRMLPGNNMSNYVLFLNSTSSAGSGITFSQRTTVYQASIMTIGPPTNVNATLTLYKSTTTAFVGSEFATGILVANSPHALVVRASTTFRPFVDYLQVEINLPGVQSSNATAFNVIVSIY
jgi:hypothetical protein